MVPPEENTHQARGQQQPTQGGRRGKRHGGWERGVEALCVFCHSHTVCCCPGVGVWCFHSLLSHGGLSCIKSLYFCFVAFSTVGFRDLVSSQEESYGGAPSGTYLPHHAPGVYCTYSLFNALSVIIKQGLNRILNQLINLRSCLCHGRLLRCPLLPMYLPNTVGKCLCAGATVETLCHRNMDLSTTKDREMRQHGCRLPGGDVIHVGLP